MMKVTINCPNGRYIDGMKIWCDKAGNYCAFQYFKNCKGWWALTEKADGCLLRKGNK